MAAKPEQFARGKIDQLLASAGWAVQSAEKAKIDAARAACVFFLLHDFTEEEEW
jgi:hypothetical protein